MSPLQPSSVPSNGLFKPRRTNRACCSCRKHKVKCLPQVDHLGHPCERCLTRGLPCKYMPVQRQTISDATDAGPAPPDGAAQGPTGDNTVILSDATQYDFVSGAAHFPVPDTAYETHSDDDRRSVDVTQFANQSASDPRGFVQLPGPDQLPERPHYYGSSILSPYASSSNTNTVWQAHDAIEPVLAESSSLPWVHSYNACPYHGPYACNCPPERHGPFEE